jgi:RecA-family ATPase
VKLTQQQDSKFAWPPPFVEEFCEQVDSEPSPTWLLENLIPTDAAVLMSGKAKVSFKSWLIFEMCRVLAIGKEHNHLKPANGPVKSLIIEAEGPRKQTRSRWAMLENASATGIPSGMIRFAHRYPITLDDPKWREPIVRLIKEEGIQLVVLDTFAKSFRGDENSSEDVGEAMRQLDILRHAGTPEKPVTVVFIHHVNKAMSRPDVETDIDDDIRGSSSLAGFYDVHLALRKTYPTQKANDLIVRSSDDETYTYRVHWSFDKEAQTAALEMTPMDADEIDADILETCADALVDHGVYTFKALKQAWNMPTDMVNAVRDRLVAAGILEKAGRGWQLNTKGE